MRYRSVLMPLGVLVSACMLAVACEGSGVSVESVVSTTASPIPSVASTSVGSTESDLNSTPGSSAPHSPAESTELSDRAAAEAQWIKSWDVYLSIAATPVDEREALAATVTVDPAKSKMLADAAEFDRQGLQTYGQLGHRISWPKPINGSDTALIDDCQDGSQTGSMETSTGKKVTVGVARDHYQGKLIRDDHGTWKVAESYYLKDEPC